MQTHSERGFNDWLTEGMENKWVGPPVCIIHDGMPCTEDESIMILEGEDPCIHMMRCYEDDETKTAVEENHSPSNWRKEDFANDNQ